MCYPFPGALESYGNHVRARRLELGWTQQRTAAHLGVSEHALNDWECGRMEPKARRLPRIMEFLGYEPDCDRYSAAELVGRIRRLSGLSLERLAERAGVSDDTLANLEKGRYQPSRRTYERLKQLAAGLEP